MSDPTTTPTPSCPAEIIRELLDTLDLEMGGETEGMKRAKAYLATLPPTPAAETPAPRPETPDEQRVREKIASVKERADRLYLEANDVLASLAEAKLDTDELCGILATVLAELARLRADAATGRERERLAVEVAEAAKEHYEAGVAINRFKWTDSLPDGLQSRFDSAARRFGDAVSAYRAVASQGGAGREG